MLRLSIGVQAMTLFDWLMIWIALQLPLGMFVGAFIKAGRR